MDAMANPTSSDVNPAVMALAYDGEWYSFADFVDWYEQDGQRVWDDARADPQRCSPDPALQALAFDGQWYTVHEFIQWYDSAV